MTNLASAADRGYHPFWLRFHDGDVEQAFIQHNNARVRIQVRVVAIIVILVIIALTAVEYVGLDRRGWPADEAESWFASLPVRVFDVLVLGVGVALSWSDRAVRHGQTLVMVFSVVLFGLVIYAAAHVGPAITLLTLFVNYGLAIILLAFGLLFRLGLILGVVFPLVFAPFIFQWMDQPAAPAMLLFATAATMLWIAYALERARRTAWSDAAALAEEQALTERLLLNVLPPSIARRMQAGETLIADSHDEATVVFADIVDFTPLSASMTPADLVAMLDEIFAAFDAIADAHDLEKIKTIGDAYMMAAGLPTERSTDPTNALSAALAMRQRIGEIAAARGVPLTLRAGIHIGPVVAGVIGRRKFVYDLWGDSVNVASRMETTAPPGAIQATDAVYRAMKDRFRFAPRGEIEVKGKGRMKTWLLEGPA